MALESTTSSHCESVKMPALPPELLRQICRLSTLPTRPEKSFPFRGQSGPHEWRTKLSLVLVCKQWRAIANEFLYEEIYLGDRSHRLLETLEESGQGSDEVGYGRWVRRLILSHRKLLRPIRLVDLLRYCFRVRTLVKPLYDPRDLSGDPPFWENILHAQSDTPTPPFASLSSLQHLYWACSASSIRLPRYEEIDLMRLSEILLHSPNLQALYVVIPAGELFGRLTCRSPGSILLPSLQKLVLATISPSLSQLGIRVDDVPNLTHLAFYPFSRTLHDGHSTAFDLLHELGKQLRTVEILPGSGIMENSVIQEILQECPNIHEFIYNIHPIQLDFECLPAPLTALTTIRIRFDTNVHTSRPYVSYGINRLTEIELQAETFRHVENHFNALVGQTFPALRRIVLDGQHWAWPVRDPRFVPLRESLHRRGYRVELPDGTLA